MEYRNFGKTGVRVSSLGFGAMRLPLKDSENPADIDKKAAVSMIRKAIDSGINYVDTAYFYHNGESEKTVGLALSEGYREKTFLATKLPMPEIRCSEDFERLLSIQLNRLRTDYIDFYLLHALNLERWEMCKKFGFIEKMHRAKAQGTVRHIGFSFHDSQDVFMKILDEFEGAEFCQIQYNYLDTDYQAGSEGLKEAEKRGLGVVVMEPLRGGRLVSPPASVENALPSGRTPVENALSFIWDKPGVSLLLSGMTTEKQLDENMHYAEKSRINCLDEEDKKAFVRAKKEYDKLSLVPCTSCLYCKGCPENIDIPGIFSVWNRALTEGRRAASGSVPLIKEQVEKCISCGRCEKNCPQNIEIISTLKKIAGGF